MRDDATALGKRVQLELGGQNPLVVMADADLRPAVEAAYAGAFFAAGQKCTATRRLFVHQHVYDEFRERLLERMSRAVIGDPTDPRTELGPLINRRQYDSALATVQRLSARYKRASSTSTRQQREPRSTSHSAASRRRGGDARRSSSTRT